MERLMLFSSDCHAGLLTEKYPDYFEAKYQEQLSAYLSSEKRKKATRLQFKEGDNKEGGLMESNKERRIEVSTQLDKRLSVLDEDGFVGEILFPDGFPHDVIPFSERAGGIGDYEPELYAAALRAYNRWLGESVAPDRQIGLALIPLLDPEYAAEQVRSARSLGLGGIVPQWDGVDTTFPPLYDKRFDPMWSACVEDRLPVNFHNGCGAPERMYERERSTAEGKIILAAESCYWGRRPLWHLIFGGVLERHPDLRVGFVELFADWVPRTLEFMDYLWTERGDSNFRKVCPLRPTEYWARQCFVGASPMSVIEVQQYGAFAPGTFSFGSDFPHLVYPWGKSREYLQATLGVAGVKEAHARAILGENIAKIYGLDMEKLSKIADAIGPTADDILAFPENVDPSAELPALIKSLRVDRPLSN
jgi:predicted TIM-barrel fold metal-dependent hydrolase